MGGRARASVWVLLEAGQLLRSGMEQREVAAKVGIGLSTLQRYLTNDDVAMFQERSRRESALTLEQREEIRVGIEHCRSDADIAATIGCHRSTVWREIARNGGRREYRAALSDTRPPATGAAPSRAGLLSDRWCGSGCKSCW